MSWGMEECVHTHTELAHKTTKTGKQDTLGKIVVCGVVRVPAQ